MFHSTIAEYFQSWDKFLGAYYEPIRAALGLMPFVGEDRADDVAQGFFLKMYERDLLTNRPAIEGRFRNWLYVAARHHALDELRKVQRRRERPDAFDVREPADPRAAPRRRPIRRRRVLCLERPAHDGRPGAQAPAGGGQVRALDDLRGAGPGPAGARPRGQVARELLAMFPGERPIFLDNRMTTVKRVFRRILPALIPVDPTESLTPEQRFQELLDILHASANSRLWLAFLLDPEPSPEASTSSSLDLAVRPTGREEPDAIDSPDIHHDELRVLLGFWLEMPLHDYLDDRRSSARPGRAAIRQSRPLVRRDGPTAAAPRSI